MPYGWVVGLPGRAFWRHGQPFAAFFRLLWICRLLHHSKRTLIAMASNLLGLEAMASNLLAMALSGDGPRPQRS